MKRILLISPNLEKKPFAVFPLGLGYLRSGLQAAGYECGILDFAHLAFTCENLLQYVNAYNPVLVGITIRNIDNCCMQHPRGFVYPVRQTVQWIRDWNPEIPIVIGGSGFSLLPRPWLETVGADFGIVGSGVTVFVRLVNELMARGKKSKRNKGPTLLYSRFAREPALPFPDRGGFLHPLDPRVSLRHNVRTGSGCTFRCTYCAYPFLEGKKVRARPAHEVREEIRTMVEDRGIYSFDFVDSVFNEPGAHAEAVCRALAEARLNVRWGCFMTPGNVSPSLIHWLKAGGCHFVEWGIDSGSPTILHQLKKKFRPRDIQNAVRLCRDYELPFSVSLLFGGPGETMTTIKETFDLMERLNIEDGFGLAGIRVLPNTEIHKRFCKHWDYQALLEPRFYFSDGLARHTLYREFETFREKYPRWILL